MADNARNRKPLNLRMPPEIIERLQNVVYWVGRGLTITSIVEDATIKALERLEAQYRKEHGKDVPARPAK